MGQEFLEGKFLEKVKSEKLLNNAYLFAKEAHAGQKRKNGGDYSLHLEREGIMLYSWGVTNPIIAAGALHDIVEDRNITLSEIRDRFGERVAFLVDGVTKVEDDATGQRTLEKIAQYSAKDLGVLLIKLADRIDNLESPAPLEWKRERYYESTRDFLIPLAKFYGLDNIASELEKSLKNLE